EQAASADIHDRGDLRKVPGSHVGELEKGPQDLRRQIVDHVPAEVLECVRRGGATCSRHPGDDEELALFCGRHALLPSLLPAYRVAGACPPARCAWMVDARTGPMPATSPICSGLDARS